MLMSKETVILLALPGQVPHLAVPDLPAGRGLPRLPHAQLHHQADQRRRLPGRDHQHQHGGPADRGLLQDTQGRPTGLMIILQIQGV